MDIRHNAKHQPSGTYTRFVDGLYYLSRSEVNDNYTLSARLAYTPSPALSFFMQPDYLAGERDASQSGTLVPTRTSRPAQLLGGRQPEPAPGAQGAPHRRHPANLSRRPRPSATLDGTLTASQLRTESDFWNGSLQLSWEL